MAFVQEVDLKFLFHGPLAILSEAALNPNWVGSVSFGRTRISMLQKRASVSRRLLSSSPFTPE
jgi:hypothetical protein